MLAKSWSKKYKFVGEDMTISAAAKEHGFGTYVPQHPKKILSLWGSLPEFGWKYGMTEVAISVNPANSNKMREAFREIRASGWRCLLEVNPEYLQEFLSTLEQRQASPNLAQVLKASVNQLLPFFGKKPPIFLGEKKYSPMIQKLFALQAEDYHVLENERDEIEIVRLFKTLRRGALHIFFTDFYEKHKSFLEQWGLREGVDFTDGRGLLVATMN